MASKFLKNNFKSMNEEDKEKWNKKNAEYFKKYKDTIKGTISDEELELLKSVLPK